MCRVQNQTLILLITFFNDIIAFIYWNGNVSILYNVRPVLIDNVCSLSRVCYFSFERNVQKCVYHLTIWYSSSGITRWNTYHINFLCFLIQKLDNCNHFFNWNYCKPCMWAWNLFYVANLLLDNYYLFKHKAPLLDYDNPTLWWSDWSWYRTFFILKVLD